MSFQLSFRISGFVISELDNEICSGGRLELPLRLIILQINTTWKIRYMLLFDVFCFVLFFKKDWNYSNVIQKLLISSKAYTVMKRLNSQILPFHQFFRWTFWSYFKSNHFSLRANLKEKMSSSIVNSFQTFSLQYFVFDFHVPPDVMFDKIIKLSVSNSLTQNVHCSSAKQIVIPLFCMFVCIWIANITSFNSQLWSTLLPKYCIFVNILVQNKF